jgi:5-methylcytosine-specific restriction endonuclease McrA
MKKLNQEVFKLNKLWQLIGVVNVREALEGMAANRLTALRCIEGSFIPYRMEDWLKIAPEDREPYIGMSNDRTTGLQRRIAIPKVVITVRYDKLVVTPPKLTMRNLRRRDNDTCQISGKKLKPSEMSMEHVIPVSKGGRKVWTNIVLCHRDYNSLRGNRPYEELGWKLIRQPFEPKGRKPEEIYPHWGEFFEEAA